MGPFNELQKTSDALALAHPEIPARLAKELVVIVASCKSVFNPDLSDAHVAYRHTFEEEGCARCQRRVDLRRKELQRSGILKDEIGTADATLT